MKSRGESGFAMLLVFALAAAVAIKLYIETPRILFEAQRQKEQLLIDRGEEYKRAIQLYFRKSKQYPPTIDALENTNNVRFLRKKYEDPVSGKKEWRLIHVGPGGVFTDSITNKPKDQGEKKDQAFNPYLVNSTILGSAPPPGAATAVPPRRASEGQQPKAGETTLIVGPQPGVPYQPQPFPGQSYPGQASPAPSYPGQPSPAPSYPGQQVPGQTPFAGQAFFAGQPYQNQQIPGQQSPGAPPPQAGGGFGSFYPAPPVNSQTGGVSQQQPSPYSGQASPYPNQQGGSNAFPVPGQNEATRMIGQLLTSPRPGGPPPGIGAPLGGGAQIGAGIAGVASLSEQTGIKIYNERDKYNEWEFIYDFSKDKTMVGAAAGLPAAGTPGAAPFGTPAGPVQPNQPGGGSLGFQPLPGSFGQQPTGGGNFPGQPPGQQFPQPGISGVGYVPRPGGQTGQNPVPLPSAGSSGGGFGGGFGSGFGGGFGAPAPGAGQPGQPGAQPAPQPGVPVRPRNQ